MLSLTAGCRPIALFTWSWKQVGSSSTPCTSFELGTRRMLEQRVLMFWLWTTDTRRHDTHPFRLHTLLHTACTLPSVPLFHSTILDIGFTANGSPNHWRLFSC